MDNWLKHSNWLKYVVTLIIGGLLVSIGYLIGNSTPDVNAQDEITEFDIVKCKGLIVSDGNPEHGSIILGFIEKRPMLVLSDHADFSKAKIQIQINIKEPEHGLEAAVLRLINDHDDGTSIGLFADRNESAQINVSTKNRINNALGLWVGSKSSAIMLENDPIHVSER